MAGPFPLDSKQKLILFECRKRNDSAYLSLENSAARLVNVAGRGSAGSEIVGGRGPG
jgi:hypothetical protein